MSCNKPDCERCAASNAANATYAFPKCPSVWDGLPCILPKGHAGRHTDRAGVSRLAWSDVTVFRAQLKKIAEAWAPVRAKKHDCGGHVEVSVSVVDWYALADAIFEAEEGLET